MHNCMTVSVHNSHSVGLLFSCSLFDPLCLTLTAKSLIHMPHSCLWWWCCIISPQLRHLDSILRPCCC